MGSCHELVDGKPAVAIFIVLGRVLRMAQDECEMASPKKGASASQQMRPRAGQRTPRAIAALWEEQAAVPLDLS